MATRVRFHIVVTTDTLGGMTEFDALIARLGLNELDGHKYLGPLGRGAQGQVCRYERPDGGEVAVKLLVAPTDPYAVKRFEAEAQALLDIAKVGLEGTIVRGLTPVRKVPDLPVFYFMMEKASGQPLSSRIDSSRPPWPWRSAVETLWRVATALAPAHVRTVVHRDLHPGNVMIHDETYRTPARIEDMVPCATILDLGVHRYSLAPFAGELTEPPPTFRPVGSVRYASPEALNDPESVTPRSDVWALGTMLYVMLTGAVPFEAPTLRGLADIKAAGRARPRAAATDASDAEDQMLNDLLHTMLNPRSDARPDASDVRNMCGDALLHSLAESFAASAGFRSLYLSKHGRVGLCVYCKGVAGRNGVRCEACGYADDEYLHWSHGS